MKYPLNIHVIWHEDSQISKKIATELYNTCSRDYKNPLSRGLGIPVYYRCKKLNDGSLLPIDLNNAEKNAIILLIDEEYFDDEVFVAYTKELLKVIDNNNRIFPISLYEKAHTISSELGKIQFTNARVFLNKKLDLELEEDLSKAIEKIKSEILHDCSRLLMDFQKIADDIEADRINSPVKLFLSHAKKDGEILAIKFKQFIENNLKLDVFFDTVDIANGYDFAEQFSKNISESALLVFHTDEYSNREWCRREVLLAKKHKSPIVVVHSIKDGESRAFPYLGNMPTTVLTEENDYNFYRIVYLTLLQVLNNLYQHRLLSQYKEFTQKQVYTLTSPPELINLIHLEMNEEETIVLYPDPPLGIEETSILNRFNKNLKFVTPITINKI